VSVRCIWPWAPGSNSMTMKRVPLGGGCVGSFRWPQSSISLASPRGISIGIVSEAHTAIEADVGAELFTLSASPSMITFALLVRSWPVTTRRTLRVGVFAPVIDRVLIVFGPTRAASYPGRLRQIDHNRHRLFRR